MSKCVLNNLNTSLAAWTISSLTYRAAVSSHWVFTVRYSGELQVSILITISIQHIGKKDKGTKMTSSTSIYFTMLLQSNYTFCCLTLNSNLKKTRSALIIRWPADFLSYSPCDDLYGLKVSGWIQGLLVVMYLNCRTSVLKTCYALNDETWGDKNTMI